MTQVMSEGFFKALQYAYAVDVTVRFTRHIPIRTPHHAPDAWRSAIPRPCLVLWADHRLDDQRGCALIHEVHHAALWGLTGVNPNAHDEVGGMLALDHAAMRSCRLPWNIWMRDFWIGEGTWWQNKRSVLRQWLAESYGYARDDGWMNKNNKPTLGGRHG